MLLIADIDGQPAALLNIRFEPGLIGKTNYTTTIQSTPNNYLCEHGGKATPFIEVSNTPESYGEVLYDAEQFDWGEFYLGKTKRFLIVKLKKSIPAPPNFFWLGVRDMPSLMLKNNLITNDLRTILPFLLHPQKNNPLHSQQNLSTSNNKNHLKKQLFSSTTKDIRGVAISYYRSITENREISCWIQPLLTPPGRMHICLTTKNDAATTLYAIQLRTQIGLTGRLLWFPASVAETTPYIKITTCAEGGRFWQYPIDIELRKLGAKSHTDDTENKSTKWVTEAELMQIAHTTLASSLELRMAISIIFADN
jgi:oxidase EvaA